jgi:hypothetical protein
MALLLAPDVEPWSHRLYILTGDDITIEDELAAVGAAIRLGAQSMPQTSGAALRMSRAV